MKVLGVYGGLGSGKDTVADLLVAEHCFTKWAFATPLKEAVQVIFDFPEEHVYGPSQLRNIPDTRYPFGGTCLTCTKDCRFHGGWVCDTCGQTYPAYITPRLALQTMGTEWGRKLSPSIWVDACLGRIQRSSTGNHVISDVRFPNEAVSIIHMGGAVLRIIRPNEGGIYSRHESERSMDNFPENKYLATIHNDADLDTLYTRVRDIVIPYLEEADT